MSEYSIYRLQHGTSIIHNIPTWYYPILFSAILFIIGKFTILPKVREVRKISAKIDYETDCLIQEEDYVLFLGRFKKTMKLGVFKRVSKISLLYQPKAQIKKKLSPDNYDVHEKGPNRKIILTNLSHLRSEDVDSISVISYTKQNQDYRKKIIQRELTNSLLIENGNYENITNYSIIFNNHPKLKNRIKLTNFGDLNIPEEGSVEKSILKITIPGRTGDSNGKVEIPKDILSEEQ